MIECEDIIEFFDCVVVGNEVVLEEFFDVVYQYLWGIVYNVCVCQVGFLVLVMMEIVYEVYLCMVCLDKGFENWGYFYVVVCFVMKWFFVDQVWCWLLVKCGGDQEVLFFDEFCVVDELCEVEFFLSFYYFLEKFGKVDDWLCKVVEFCFFGGFFEVQMVEVFGVGFWIVRCDWVCVCVWLCFYFES